MSGTNYLALRSQPPTNVGTVKSNLTAGSYTASNWQAVRSTLTANKKIQMSSTGQYQLSVTSPTVYLSSDSGSTWTTLGTANGLPTGATWLNGSISATGQYLLLVDNADGIAWVSADYGQSFNNTTPSSVTPYAWYKFNSTTTDTQGNSTATVNGSITYVTGTIPGQNAVSISNGAGGSASNYIRGSWSAPDNFTVSFWMNPQTASSGTIFRTYSNGVAIYLSSGNLYFAVPSNGGLSNVAGTPYVVIPNTWYFVTAVFQKNSVCSFYVNNTLIGTMVNSGGFGSYVSSGIFSIGCDETSVANAYNGYVCDLKLMNQAITYQPVAYIPPAVWLKLENDLTEAGSLTTSPVAMGSPSYVTGATGLYAVNLVNTVNGSTTASQYIYGAWTGSTSFTISFWMNAQTINNIQQDVQWTYGGSCGIYLNTSNQLVYYMPSGGTSVNAVTTSFTIVPNTWYHVYYTFQSNSIGSLIVNGQLIGQYTNSGGLGSNTTSQYYLGTFSALGSPFNGYIDDFKIYNTLVPYTALQTMNYNSCAISGSGQYMYVASSLGYTLQSSDYGVTWSIPSAIQGPQQSQTELTVSHTGQHALVTRRKIVTPTLYGNASASWYQNGITWTASASSSYSGMQPYSAFNDSQTAVWDSASNYTYPTGVYTNVNSMTILGGIGTVYGEWLQLQSSVPLQLIGYSYAVAGPTQLPKTYYIVGSVDGTAWYPLQYGSMTGNPATTSYVRCNTVIAMNYTGTQSLKGDQVGSVTTTAYPAYTTAAYKYFRIIGTSTWNGGEMGFTEFFPQFIAPTICPTYTGLASLTWAQQGVTWTASASSTAGGFPASGAFNNNLAAGQTSWASAAIYNGSNGTYGGSVSTVVQGGVGSVSGEYLQLQSSVPLVMSSHSYASLGPNLAPKTFYIVGSNDNGATWYPVQYVAFGSTNPLSTANTALKTAILVGYSGTQAVTGDTTQTITTTAYSTTGTPFTQYRIIATSIWPSNSFGNFELSEWIVNFALPSFYTNTSAVTWTANPLLNAPPTTLSGNGQYAIATASSPIPFAHLTFDNGTADAYGQVTYLSTTTNGGSSTSLSTSIYKVGKGSAYFYSPSTGTAANACLVYSLPSALSAPSALTMSCWVYQTVQATNGTPMLLSDGTNYGPEFYISGSGVVNVYWASTTATGGSALPSTGANTSIPANAWSHLAMTYSNGFMTLYVNGVVASAGVVTGNLCSVGGNALSRMLIGSAVNYNGYNGYVDDVRLYTTALSPQQIIWLYSCSTNNPSITVTTNYLTATAATPTPINPLITAPPTSSAISFSGQTMVVTTAATTNNIYYSTDTGATWTPLTIPLSSTESLIGSAVSYDGTMIEVMSNTATYFINTNTAGNSIAIGSQAGQYNQAQNAIAIGTKAAPRNQATNSIALNATGQQLNASTAGFYVAPIQAATAAASNSITLLGYGADSQVVQATSSTINPVSGVMSINSNVGIGTTNPLYRMDIQQPLVASGNFPAGSLNFSTTNGPSYWSLGRIQGYVAAGAGGSTASYPGGLAFYTKPSNVLADDSTVVRMVLDSQGYLGIGKTTPSYLLDVNGSLNCTGLLVNGTAVATGTGSVWSVSGSTIMYTSGNVGIGTTNPTSKLTIYSTAYNTHQLIIGGQEFYANGWASTGISINAGVNRSGNKQLWIMDPDLAISSSNTGIRLIPGPGRSYIDSVTTDGSAISGLTIAGSTIALNATAVGIGITNPSTKFWVSTGSTATTLGGTGQWSGIHLQPSGTSDSLMGITFGGIGSGYDSQTHAGIVCQASGAYGHKLFFQTTNDWSAGAKTRMVIDHQGYMGVGRSDAGYQLDVQTPSTGANEAYPLRVLRTNTGANYGAGILHQIGSYTTGHTFMGIAGSVGANATGYFVLDPSYNNSIPSSNMYTSGLLYGVRSNGNTSNCGSVTVNGVLSVGSNGVPNGGSLNLYNADGGYVTQRIVHNTASNWALWMQAGTATGQAASFIVFQNYVNSNQRGSITSSGDNTISYNTGSDIRFKEDIEDIIDARPTLDLLRPRTFHMKGHEDPMRIHGFIAQEVPTQLRYLVTEGQTDDKYLYMDYSKVAPIAIAGVKQLYDITDNLKTRIAEQDVIIQSLVSQVHTLMSRLGA